MGEAFKNGMGIVVEPTGRAAGTMADNMNISPVKKKVGGFITCVDASGISIIIMRGQAEGGAIEGFMPNGKGFKAFFKLAGGMNKAYATEKAKHFRRVFPDGFLTKKR